MGTFIKIISERVGEEEDEGEGMREEREDEGKSEGDVGRKERGKK
jgi:hypothetical protein